MEFVYFWKSCIGVLFKIFLFGKIYNFYLEKGRYLVVVFYKRIIILRGDLIIL